MDRARLNLALVRFRQQQLGPSLLTKSGECRSRGLLSRYNLTESTDGEKMAARLGEVLFWACIILAGLWLYAVYGPGAGPKVDITGYAIAASLVLIGWALRYILAGRKS
jgi:hypothetical protein